MISLSKYWSTKTLILKCTRRPANERAWQEFVRRYHVTIRGSVASAFSARASTHPQSNFVLGGHLQDSLVQSVYRRLVENRNRSLNDFIADGHSSFKTYLTIVCVKVVSEHFSQRVEPQEAVVPGAARAFARSNGAGSIKRQTLGHVVQAP